MLDGIKIEDQFRTGAESLALMLGEFLTETTNNTLLYIEVSQLFQRDV